MVAGLLATLLASYAGAMSVARVPARAVPALGAPAVGVSWSGGTLARPAIGAATLSPSLPSVKLGVGSVGAAPAAAAVGYSQEYGIRAPADKSAEAQSIAPEEMALGSSARAESVDNPEVTPSGETARAAARAGKQLNPPLASSVQVKDSTLNTLFDGSRPLPSGSEVLARAGKNRIGSVVLARAIANAASLEEALSSLRSAGVLGKEEQGDATRSRLMLLRVWHAVAAAAPAEPLSVEAAGVTYHIHPVVHGQAVPLRSRAARAVVARLKTAGAALLSEQDLGRLYGFAYGHETRDHKASAGAAAEVRAQPGSAARRILWTALLGPLALLVWRLLYARLARRAVSEGDADLAHWLRARAGALFGRSLDLEAARRTELPAALTLEEGDWTALRSVSMAASAAAFAAAQGLKELHLLVGVKHARQLAALLARGPRPEA